MKVNRVINIEDTMMKHIAIWRALRNHGVDVVDHAKTAEDGLCMIEEAIAKGEPYDLLITDMHFSVYGKDDRQAGLYVVRQLKEKGIQLPIVVCSSLRYTIEEIEGCIFYNERSQDLDGDIGQVIKRLRNK